MESHDIRSIRGKIMDIITRIACYILTTIAVVFVLCLEGAAVLSVGLGWKDVNGLNPGFGTAMIIVGALLGWWGLHILAFLYRTWQEHNFIEEAVKKHIDEELTVYSID